MATILVLLGISFSFSTWTFLKTIFIGYHTPPVHSILIHHQGIIGPAFGGIELSHFAATAGISMSGMVAGLGLFRGMGKEGAIL
ncbi:MAG: hypothetical protein WAL98_03070 [Desulfatiglandaceae bacterium]